MSGSMYRKTSWQLRLLLPGHAHDMKDVAPLIRGVSFDALLVDKAFDVDWLLQDLDQRNATAVIPQSQPQNLARL